MTPDDQPPTPTEPGPAHPDPAAWGAVALAVEQALLAQPLDGLLDLLLPRTTLTATWLLPGQVLLELSGAPPGCAAQLHREGWVPRRPGAWARPCAGGRAGPAGRARAARQAGQEAAAVLRDVLAADPADVELWQPGLPPAPWPAEHAAPLHDVQDALW